MYLGAQPALRTVRIMALVPERIDLNWGYIKWQFMHYQLRRIAGDLHKMAWQHGQ
jgi:hypothetical protein